MTLSYRATTANDDKSAPLDICIVMCLILVAIAVVGCLFSRIVNTRSVSVDVATVLIAFALAISQSAALLVSCESGLATTRPSNSRVEKAFYASSILNVATIVTSKAAAALFIRALIPYQSQRRLGAAFLVFLGLWGASSAIASALQCDTTRPWTSQARGVCINKAFWLSFNTISIVTDATIVTWALRIVSKLQMALSRKLFVATCFASRLLAIVATAAQIAMQDKLDTSVQVNLSIFNVVVCTQVAQSLSVITACAPHLVTFFGSMVSGMLRADDIRRQHGSSIDDSQFPNPKRSYSMFRSTKASLKSYVKPSAGAQPPAVPLQALNQWHRVSDSRSRVEHSNSSQDNVILRATDIDVIAEPGMQEGSSSQVVAPWEYHGQDGMVSKSPLDAAYGKY